MPGSVDWAKTVSEALQQPVKGVQARRLSSLWAGYGRITSLAVSLADNKQLQLIAKQVDPPRGGGVSHERKLRSYAAEASFYSHCAPLLLEAGHCAVPRPYLVETSPPAHFFFILSDLREQFPDELHSYSLQEAQAAINWLAAFHAFWWEEVPPDTASSSSSGSGSAGNAPSSPAAAAVAAAGMWPQGCYWHLETRQEELQQMGGSWGELRQAAAAVDEAIRGIKGSDSSRTSSSRFRTLVHGDFKSANVLFNSDATECAAYDFQYVGAGYGVRDLVYMLCSSVEEDVLEQQEQQLLDHYHRQLQQQLRAAGKAAAAERYSREVLAVHFELCLVDYVRFMAGWGMWGNSRFFTRRCREAMKQLPALLKQAEGFL